MARQKRDNLIPIISNANFGGLSDSLYSGIKYSLYKLTGFDPHSTPGLLKVAQKMTAETTGVEPTELCKERVSCSNGIRYWFSSTTGKVWQDKAGTWSLVATLTATAGGVAILGAAEYHGYIYMATESRLHRIPIAASAADGAAAWTSNLVLNWKTFTITNASFHPMFETPGQVLYIGDGNYLAQVDAGTAAVGSEVFTADALDIKTPLQIKSLGGYGTDLLLGTYVADTVTATQIIRWNTWNTDTFQSLDEIPEVGVNAFLPGDNVTFAQCGLAGRIYVYNGEKLELYKTIPGDYSPTATAEVYPSSVAQIGGDIYFGVSNVTGNPCDQGIYRLGRHSKNYPYILDFPYPISERLAGEFVITGVNMGGLLAVANVLYGAWKNNAGAGTYGVDKLDYTTKLDGAYLETMVMRPDRFTKSIFSLVEIAYALLPASTVISLAYKNNYAASYVDMTEVVDTDRNVVYSEEGIEANVFQLRTKMTTSVNTAPEIESGLITLQ